MTAPMVAETGPIRSAFEWPSNAELIADVAALGYLDARQVVIDATYGFGVWWKKWCPSELIKHDLRHDHVDSRKLPEPDDFADALALDLPYVATGSRTKTTIKEFYDRYGLTEAPRTPAQVQALINDSMAEAGRVLKPYRKGTATRPTQGILLVKCMSYTSGGKLWPGTHKTWEHAMKLGFRLIDEFQMVGEPNMQPGDKPKPDGTPSRVNGKGEPVQQASARQNVSVLFVFGAPRVLRAA